MVGASENGAAPRLFYGAAGYVNERAASRPALAMLWLSMLRDVLGLGGKARSGSW